jgi:hypothetical protein
MFYPVFMLVPRIALFRALFGNSRLCYRFATGCRLAAMQEWTSLRLELLAHGYRKIEYWQFGCPNHGTFRVATEIPIESYACPRCHRLYEASFVLEGFTRRRLPIVELIEPPLTKRTRFALLGTRRVRHQIAMSQD